MMANQKPVDEIRIGRVKATVWRNGTEDQPRYNVTFSRLFERPLRFAAIGVARCLNPICMCRWEKGILTRISCFAIFVL